MKRSGPNIKSSSTEMSVKVFHSPTIILSRSHVIAVDGLINDMENILYLCEVLK